MSYLVKIKKNETGEIRECKMEFDWFKENGDDYFWWTEGNFGCDCNRHNEFRRANGESWQDIECSSHLYTVIEAILPDGTRIPIDE